MNPYLTRVKRWSKSGSVTEALAAVRKEVDRRMAARKVPLVVRIEAVEAVLVEVAALTVSVVARQDMSPTEAIDTMKVAIEFLRLDLLYDAIELHELQKGQQ